MESVVGGIEYVQPFHCLLVIISADEDTVALAVASPHTSTQLMQLGQAEALGIFNHHNRCVRNVDPHFNDCGGNQHINFFF